MKKLLSLFRRHHHHEEDPLSEIQRELSNIRNEIVRIESLLNVVCDEHHEYLSHELNALREKEHLLIKNAKKLRGIHPNIQTSLREYHEALTRLS